MSVCFAKLKQAGIKKRRLSGGRSLVSATVEQRKTAARPTNCRTRRSACQKSTLKKRKCIIHSSNLQKHNLQPLHGSSWRHLLAVIEMQLPPNFAR